MTKDPDFYRRREKAREALDLLPEHASGDAGADRAAFFHQVYARAESDEAAVPWADLAPKAELCEWLSANPGAGRTAIDIACGLGDNAEAIAEAGYQTTAFDVVPEAVEWAKRRFANSLIDYRVADLFNLPSPWQGSFDLVHECFTLQALPESMLARTTEAIAGLMARGGLLLVYTRWRRDGTPVSGPPFPLEERHLLMPQSFGLCRIEEKRFTIERADRAIPHVFSIWQKPV